MSRVAWVDKKLMASMSAESEYWCPKETGGVLMGYWSHQDVVITDIVGPGPKAVHRRFSFTPDAKWQEKEVARIYEESGRIITYLGDWHSHPFGTSRLSFKDIVTLFRVAVHKPARAPRPIMGILHNNSLWKLEIWNFKFSEIFSCVPATTMKIIWFDE